MKQKLRKQVIKLLKKEKKPFYIYDKKGIIDNCKKFMDIPYKDKIVAFATMANSNIDFLKIIKSEGMSVFVNSIPHLHSSLDIGFKPKQIVYTSSSMDNETMKEIQKSKCIVNLDSISQINRWKKLFPNNSFGIRCNIGTLVKAKETRGGYFLGKKSRLGLSVSEILSIDKKNIDGLHLYPGTDITEVSYFEKCYKKIIELSLHFPDLKYLDFGGGFGVETKKAKKFDMAKYSKIVSQLMDDISNKLGRQLTLVLEPGRIIGGESAWFVTMVVDVKRRWGHQFIGLNASAVQFPRPLFYPDSAYHPIIYFSKHNSHKINSSIYGCSTYSRDYFMKNKKLPIVKEDEIIVFGNAGSYCSGMFTNFLGFEKPKEVFI